jgi:hypothetical protein
MRIVWKAFPSVTYQGLPCRNDAFILNNREGGKYWLDRIQAMPPGRPLDLETAVTIAEIAGAKLCFEDPRPIREKIREMDWLISNWLDYVIQQGYRIHLRGDEYLVVKS